MTVIQLLIGFTVVIVALLLGGIVGWMWCSAKSAKNYSEEKARLNAEKEALRMKADVVEKQACEQRTTLEQRIEEMQEHEKARVAELQDQYRQRLAEVRSSLLEQYNRTLEDMRTQQQELRHQLQTQMLQQQQLISEQFTTTSERILKERSEALTTTNKEQMGALLSPLHENIRLMKEAVEKSDRDQTATMERLDASIKANLKQAQEVGERADKLARALTSENKTQGNFGELRLRQLLQNMGLEEGVQFEEQVTLRDEHGKAVVDDESGRRKQPDVILHFPDGRDVVIDAKMSITAFTQYYEAQDDEQRKIALDNHVKSMRQHVKELAHKNYSSYLRDGHQQLDFVMMYVFSESALQLALANDPTLWKEAYDQGVVIAGSQSLYMMLRILEMTWKQVRQVENQQKIMDAANAIVDRVQLFYERLGAVDDQLRRTREAFDKLKVSTAPSGPSIATAARKLLQYGAHENPKRKQRLQRLPQDADIEDADNNVAPTPLSGNQA